jgi:hypothetical protein
MLLHECISTVTSQVSYSPEYITPTQKKSKELRFAATKGGKMLAI